MGDVKCKCHAIEDEIRARHPADDWNCDTSCQEWHNRVGELEDKGIEFDDGADENYGCTCPTCGRMICGWCV